MWKKKQYKKVGIRTMETNKENVFKTKIPLPIGTLPALPKHLLEVKKQLQMQEIAPTRVPFKSLGNQISPKAGPSVSYPKSKSFTNVNTKYVTLRPKKEELDWNYSIFKDKRSLDGSVISISDDESYIDNEIQRCLHAENDLDEVMSAVTPDLKDRLVPDRVRNVKKSLKRPHSRELQGLSPEIKEEKSNNKVKRRLPFTKSLQDTTSDDNWKVAYLRCLDRDYTADIFDYLLSVESKPLNVPMCPNITRACVINWLMRVNGPNGNPFTIQTACWYLDSILGTVHIQLAKLQLTAAACYWIAQKFHGPVARAARLVRCANNAFTVDKLMNAEKAVLKKLKFTSQPVVAQDYIGYLSWHCDESQSDEIELAATFLYMCGLMVEKVLCEEYPSVIAVAAVHNALSLLKKKELLYRLETCHVFRVAEKKSTNLYFTYSVLRRAAQTVSSPSFEYKTPLEHYGASPNYIAQKIVAAAKEISVTDVRTMGGRF